MGLNKLDNDYQNLLKTILTDGKIKKTRTGTSAISVFGRQIRHNMQDGFPLLTTKKMAIKSIMTELKWFLKGDTNIKYLVDNNCHIWDGDCYQAYLKYSVPHDRQETMQEFINKIKTDDEFAAKWGELGPIYGAGWRRWKTETGEIDQLKNIINELKTNPDSRRLIVNSWNPEALDKMVLPPCHYSFTLSTRTLTENERIKILHRRHGNLGYHVVQGFDALDELYIPERELSIKYNQRSVDVPLGLPFNIASYAMLLQLISLEVNMEPGELICSLEDCHIYTNQIEGVLEQKDRLGFKQLPEVEILNSNLLEGEFEYEIKNYFSDSKIKYPLSN